MRCEVSGAGLVEQGPEVGKSSTVLLAQDAREEVAARVRAAVEASGLTNAQFATLVGTSGSRLSTYLNGRVTPSAAMLVRIERAPVCRPAR